MATKFAHALTLFVLVASMLSMSMANKDWSFGSNSNYSDWWSRFRNRHQNKTEQEPRKIIVGGSEGWHFGFNYTDWAFKNGPFYLNDTLGEIFFIICQKLWLKYLHAYIYIYIYLTYMRNVSTSLFAKNYY